MKRLMAGLIIVALVLALAPFSAVSAQGVQIDVQHYDINLQVRSEKNQMNVEATVTIRALDDDITTVPFLLNDQMEISTVKEENGNTLEFTRESDQLDIVLAEPLQKEEEKKLVIEYVGVSSPEEKMGRHGFWGYIGEEGSYMIYESAWYPMIWGDRYTAITTINAPKSQTAISVGQLIEEKEIGEYKEQTYYTTQPTRGISFAVGEYKVKSTLYQHMAVECYTYQESDSLFSRCLKTTLDMLEFYSTKFGDYPYTKFAVVEIPGFFSGGHGDQSFIMMDSNLFMSFLPSEFLAHEVAHNWWGALVFAEGENSLRSVKGYWNFPRTTSPEVTLKRNNLWLLEGFATYSSILYVEEFKGRDDMRSSLEDKRQEYIEKIQETDDEPISTVEEEYGEGKYHALVYSKGAWVLHMLRYVVGDEAFFTIMGNYAEQFRGKSANIGDFQGVSEEVYGQDMSWFFDQWIHGLMLPDYTIKDANFDIDNGKYLVKATLIQKGNQGEMPVDITLHTEGRDIKKRIWIDEEQESISFLAGSRPTHIEIDEDHWILESSKNNNVFFLEKSSFWRRIKLIIWQLRQLLPII